MLFNQLGGKNMVDMSKLFCVLIAGLAIMSCTTVGLAAPEIIAVGKTAAVKAEATKASDKAADIKKAVAIPEAAKTIAEGKAEIQDGAEPKIKSEEKK